MSDSNMELKFTCSKCNYVAQVAGKRYYEIEWQFHIETRKCINCNRLFDNIVTKTVTADEIAVQSAEHYSNNKSETEKDIADSIDDYISFLSTIKGHDKKIVECRWCCSHQNKVWNKNNPECPKCGEKMRVSKEKPVKAIKSEDFPGFKEMINAEPQVVAFFTEPTCGICRHIQLIIAEIEKEYPDEFHFVEFDYVYAEKNELISKYKLKYFPTFLHFKNGQYIGRFSNVDSKPEFLAKIRKKFDKSQNL